MSTRSTPWDPGTPAWYDLATTDLPATTRFYAATFGWELMDTGDEFGHYTFALVQGMPVAGVGPAMAGQAPLPVWSVYLAVDDADKTAEAITAHGGSVIVPPMAVAEQGRLAVAIDPTGATFGLWEAGTMFGAVLVNEPGGVVWADHRSTEPAAAQEFYGAVLGYRYSPAPGEEAYASVDGPGPGGTIAGIGGPDGDLPAELPAHWMTYFAVTSVDDTVARAVEAGGSAVTQPADTPFGRMATLRDVQGTYFKIGSSTAG